MGFTFGAKIKTIFISPILNFLQTELQLSLSRGYIFRFITEDKIVDKHLFTTECFILKNYNLTIYN